MIETVARPGLREGGGAWSRFRGVVLSIYQIGDPGPRQKRSSKEKNERLFPDSTQGSHVEFS